MGRALHPGTSPAQTAGMLAVADDAAALRIIGSTLSPVYPQARNAQTSGQVSEGCQHETRFLDPDWLPLQWMKAVLHQAMFARVGQATFE